MSEGFILLHRKIFNNEYYFSEKFCKIMAWIDLLMLANHNSKIKYIRGIKKEWKRGEVGYSVESLAKRWQWSRGKVERWLKELETSKQIVRQKSYITTTIIILNYKKYQANDTADSKTNGHQTVQQTGKQTDINNNDNNVNNVNKEIYTSSSFETLWKEYPARNGRKEDKEKSSKLYNELIQENDRKDFLQAVKNYALEKRNANVFIRNFENFILNNFWRDYIETNEKEKDYQEALIRKKKKEEDEEIEREERKNKTPEEKAKEIAENKEWWDKWKRDEKRRDEERRDEEEARREQKERRKVEENKVKIELESRRGIRRKDEENREVIRRVDFIIS